MTDVGFLITFYIFVLAMIGVSIYGWTKGHVYEFIAPQQTDGHVTCGYNEAKEYSFLFYPLTANSSEIKSYCVDKCPTDNEPVNYYNASDITIKGYKTKAVGKYCFPDDEAIINDFTEQIYDRNGQFFA